MTSTRLACLTSPGTAAIATLALHGPLAWRLVMEMSRRVLPPTPIPGQFWLTRFGEPGQSEAIELVIAAMELEPLPLVELQCHGSREVVRFLKELLAARGVEIVDWRVPELAKGQVISPLPNFGVAAKEVLINALTLRTASIALDQYHGALERALGKVRAAIGCSDLAAAASQLEELEKFSSLGAHLAEPWRVVIAGAPNVGKSSLVNALSGYQRSIVSPIPGTTRDVVTTLAAIDGWPVELADVAGISGAGENHPLEQEGVARGFKAAAEADLRLWVLNAAAAPVWPPPNFGTVQFVLNKMDLPLAWDVSSVDAMRVSALTGEGLETLCSTISRWLVPHVPPAGAAVPFTRELAASIGTIAGLIQAASVREAGLMLG